LPAADGLPEGLQTVMEAMSGFSLADVVVHRNSAEPARLGAAAFTKGSQIHVAPGQERHLPHEAWHVVQQAQGRVGPTGQLKDGIALNDDAGLEHEADVMGQRAAAGGFAPTNAPRQKLAGFSAPIQRAVIYKDDGKEVLIDTSKMGATTKVKFLTKPELEKVIAQLKAIDQPDAGEQKVLQTAEARYKAEFGSEEDKAAAELDKQRQDDLRKLAHREEEASGAIISALTKLRPEARKGTRSEESGNASNSNRVGPIARDKASPIVPKDLSARPTVFHMAFHAESNVNDPDGELGWREIESMAAIAAKEKMRVAVLVRKGADEALLRKKIEACRDAQVIDVVASDEKVSEWAEDSGEIQADKKIGLPSEKVGHEEAETWIRRERDERGYKAPAPRFGDTEHPAHRVGYAVAQDRKQVEKRALAQKAMYELKPYASHIEGGNLLTGTDAKGNTIALVGRDALAVTRGQFLKDNKGKQASDDDMRKLISADLGLDPQAVHFVEQPGQFHLDMGMVVFGGGLVMLNDSRQVFQLIEQWAAQDRALILAGLEEGLREQGAQAAFDPPAVERYFKTVLETLEKQLSVTCAFEDAALKDLKAIPNLSIHRVAGSFPHTPFNPLMNFLNGELGTSPDGNSFFITNGGTRRAEDIVAAAYFTAVKDTPLRILYFLDPEASTQSLGAGGGIGCRTKTSE
jgi:hypothetical protein